MQQTTFASLAWSAKGKVTRRERFLAEMNAVIPWARLLGLIEPYYPKAGQGTQPLPMDRMLRIYFMQNWFNLSDPGAEDALYDSESMRRFAGIELADDAIPDESTILRFRHLLERHRLTERIFAEVRGLLEDKRLLDCAPALSMRDGTSQSPSRPRSRRSYCPCASLRDAAAALRSSGVRFQRTPLDRNGWTAFRVSLQVACGHPPGPYASRGLLARALLSLARSG